VQVFKKAVYALYGRKSESILSGEGAHDDFLTPINSGPIPLAAVGAVTSRLAPLSSQSP
jgi:hypothetical protein